MTTYILSFIILWLAVSIILNNKNHRKDIQTMSDTIQKLLNREPVTYKEVGKTEPKEEEVRYSAWGSRMLTKDDYNKEL